ncbi:glycosyltransferase family 2 protein [Nostoc sp. DSM 114161]|jgi:glycosyltransferase involved in cell wall biosynthesis|uniref:glycosyltransferase family 2 protein n=1 Tax=Nostoc sp. DSM 114161 TaxID=3440143 RepID=UPI00404624BD
MTKVSIITPCYNAEKYVGKAIESVRAQSFNNWEHIVIDDGSTDNSAQVIASYTKIEPRLRLIRQPNGGVCNARNNGFKECFPQTQYLLFFDADDYLEPQMLEVIVKYLDQHPHVGVAYSDYWHIDEDDRILPRNSYSRYIPSGFGIKELPYETPETPLVAVGSGAAIVMESGSVLRRYIYEKTSGWDESLGQGGEGIDLFLQFALFSEIHFVPKNLYKYRQYPAQSHRLVDDRAQARKLIAKWKEGKWLTQEQKAKVAQVLWFYEKRLMALFEMQSGTDLMRRGQFITALRLYLEAGKKYFMSFFPASL